MRATVGTLLATLGAFGGHWLLWLCCIPLLFTGPGTGEAITHLMAFQAFALTPPVTLGELAFRAEELEKARIYDNPVEHFFFAFIGIVIFGGLTAALWSVEARRLQAATRRTLSLPR